MPENAEFVTRELYSLAVPLPFQDLPKLLRFLRKKKHKLTLQDAAAKFDVPYQTLSSYETGRSSPPYTALAKLLAHYGVHTYLDLQLAQDEFRGIVTPALAASTADKLKIAELSRSVDGLQLLLAKIEAERGGKKGG